DFHVTGVQTCALPISDEELPARADEARLEDDGRDFGVVQIGEDPANRQKQVLLRAQERQCAQEGALPRRLWARRGRRFGTGLFRSEERRVGKEGRAGW